MDAHRFQANGLKTPNHGRGDTRGTDAHLSPVSDLGSSGSRAFLRFDRRQRTPIVASPLPHLAFRR